MVGIPGKIVVADQKDKTEKADLEHGNLPDPQAKAMECLFEQIRSLENQVKKLTEEQERLRGRLNESDIAKSA